MFHVFTFIACIIRLMFSFTEYTKIPRVVKLWLLTGLVMIFFQIVIGGITRLTGSGLSITKWEIVTGAVPPLNEAAWNTEFEHYKATRRCTAD